MKGHYVAHFAGVFKTPLLLTALLLPMFAMAQVAPLELSTPERRDIVETQRLSGLLTFRPASTVAISGWAQRYRVDQERDSAAFREIANAHA